MTDWGMILLLLQALRPSVGYMVIWQAEARYYCPTTQDWVTTLTGANRRDVPVLNLDSARLRQREPVVYNNGAERAWKGE